MKQLIVMAMAATAFATVYAQDADTDREVRRWNLTSVSTQDVTNIKADANWKIDSKSRYCYLQPKILLLPLRQTPMVMYVSAAAPVLCGSVMPVP